MLPFGTQVGFKRDLVKNVKAFLQDVEKFRFDFDTNGPMVAGISAVEATDRLKRFQMLYDQRERKYKAYSAGEELFGLPPTEYPELEKTKKELDLLERLYALYINVNTFVSDAHEMLWTEVPTNLPMMIQRVTEFQTACSKMPKDLRQWDAYTELKVSGRVIPLLSTARLPPDTRHRVLLTCRSARPCTSSRDARHARVLLT